MDSIKKVTSFIIGWFLIIISIAGYFVGIFHAFKQSTAHGVVATVFVIPAYYWAADKLFFYEDVSAKNWDTELNTNTRIFAMLLEKEINHTTTAGDIKDISAMSETVSKYPLDQKLKIMQRGRDYSTYILLSSKEIIDHFTIYIAGKDVKHFRFSPKVGVLKYRLSKSGLESEMLEADQQTEYLIKEIENRLISDQVSMSTAEYARIAINMQKTYNSKYATIKSFYLRVFGAELL